MSPGPAASDQKPPDQPPPLGMKGQRYSRKGIAGFVLAFLIPPVGAVLSIMAWRETRRKNLRGRRLAIFGTVWGLLFTPFFLFFTFLFFAFNGWQAVIHGNAAQKAAKPFISSIEKAGGRKLCDNGDDGYGIDNTTPWYQVYYQIPDSSGLTGKIESFASQAGYDLHADTAQVRQLKENSDSALGFTDQERFNPRSDYLTGSNGTDKLKVTINRDASVPLYCRKVSTYGHKQAAGSGNAILDISFTAPDTNR